MIEVEITLKARVKLTGRAAVDGEQNFIDNNNTNWAPVIAFLSVVEGKCITGLDGVEVVEYIECAE